MQLKVNEELKSLIPPLTEPERNLLQQSLIDEGCREKIIIWDDTIVDGHNRYELCTKHNIPFQVEDRDFENIEAVKVWMIDNQKGRRNLTDGWKWELAQTRKMILAEKGRGKYQQTVGRPSSDKSLSTVDNDKHNTRDELAQELGWSTGKVAMADKVWKEAKPEVKEQVKTGDISINKAYQDVRKEKNKAKRKEQEQEVFKSAKKYKPIIRQMDAMQAIQDVSEIDLLLTDPPYFTDGNFTSHISAALAKVKPTGQAYVFAGAYPDEIAAYIAMDSHHMELVQMLVWNYNNTGQRQPNEKYTSNYQVCFYFRGPEAPRINKPADGKEQYACQTINAPDARIGDRYHKWQKPNDLMQRLIRNSSNVDDLVFDPFAGSGSTLVNAVLLDRAAIGSEVDPEAIAICKERGCVDEL